MLSTVSLVLCPYAYKEVAVELSDRIRQYNIIRPGFVVNPGQLVDAGLALIGPYVRPAGGGVPDAQPNNQGESHKRYREANGRDHLGGDRR